MKYIFFELIFFFDILVTNNEAFMSDAIKLLLLNGECSIFDYVLSGLLLIEYREGISITLPAGIKLSEVYWFEYSEIIVWE